jgi:dsDNA-binding SOS-regulon protein
MIIYVCVGEADYDHMVERADDIQNLLQNGGYVVEEVIACCPGFIP